MSNHRVQSFPIAQLEYVFVPPGLPLVTKSDSPATTSILVRGGAGTGKTTLAAALAHAISRDQGGVALYLTTEFVATELAYKAVTLGLEDDLVDAWDSPRAHQPGTLLAEHLVRTDAGSKEDALQTVAKRKRAAISAVWELLSRGAETIAADRGEGPPVRVVVIDGFGLPEVEQENQELRHQLVSSMQALERIGITPIIVEEAGVHAEAWLPFVVDIVFEIELWPDPDTRLLHRRLKCPKSRYVRGIPGPHDYGMEPGAPAVWPSLPIDVCQRIHWQDELAPSFFYPLASPAYLLCRAGSVIVSEFGAKQPPLLELVQQVPGMRLANVVWGPLNRVALPDGQIFCSDESDGLLAVGWALLQGFRAGRLNAVALNGLEHHLARPRTSERALHLIALLGAAGMTVCVHGRAGQLVSVANIADLTLGTQVSGRVQRRAISWGPCRAERWLEAIDEPNVRQLFAGTADPASVLNEAEALEKSEDHDAYLRAAILTHLASGVRRYINERRSKVATSAHFTAFAGDDLAAALKCLDDISSPELQYLWDGISATFTANRTFSDQLFAHIDDASPRELVRLLRICGKSDDIERMRTVAVTAGKRFDLPDWYVMRLLCESFLDRQLWFEAARDMTLLTDNSAIPRIHLAEIFHNIGVAHHHLGDPTASRAAHERALELNPLLEPAKDALM